MTVPVVWRDLPLVGAPRRWSAPEGVTLLEIVCSVPDLPPYFEEDGFLCINGEEVPREWWGRVRPKAGSEVIVSLHVRLEGGSSQKVLATVAAVAVILIAAIAAPYIAGALATSGSALFLGVQGAVGLAGSIGGALLYSALAPPPSNPQALSAGPATDMSVKPASLTGNTLGAGDNLARVLGYRRVFPSFVSQPVIELIGLVETVEGVYGLAGPHKIGSIYAGDVDTTTMPEVTTQTTDGFGSTPPQTLVQRQGYVLSPNTTLSPPLYLSSAPNQVQDVGNPALDVPYYHRFVSRVGPDEFWMSLSFAEGLIHTNGNNLAVPIRVRFRIKGLSTWTDCPEIHWRAGYASALQVTIKLMWRTAPALPTPDSARGMWAAFYSTPNQTAGGGPFTGAFTANSYFYTGSGDTFYDSANVGTTGLRNIGGFIDRVEFYLDPAVFPQDSYEVEVKRGQAYQTNNFTITNYNYNPGSGNAVYDLFGYALISGTPQWVESQTNLKHAATIIRHTSIWNAPPVGQGAPIATIAVKATGRSIQQLACDAGAYVPVTATTVGNQQSQTMTTPTTATFTVPTGVTSLTIEAWGGGGGGAGGSSTSSPGGGGGGYSRATISVSPGQTVFYRVGAGAFGGGTAGGNGQSSWVNPNLNVQPVSGGVVGGAGGGGSGVGASGAAGNGTVGTTNFSGGAGANGNGTVGGGGGGSGGSAGAGAAGTAGGAGGAGGTPDGGHGGAGGASGTAIAGSSPGGGGGGSDVAGSGASAGNGQVRFTWTSSVGLVYGVSQNPADHYKDVLTGSLGAFPLQTGQVDDLTTWHDDCDAHGYNINAVIQGMKQMDVLKLIAAAGYAKPIQSETWGVAEDFDRTGLVPTQIFTPRNLQNFQWTKSFHPYVDGIRAKFDDSTNVFVETEIVVLDPAVNTGGVRLEALRYDTITNSGDATRRALFDLAQARERLEFYSGTADIENLVCRVGDLVGVNHDVLSSEVGYARIINVNKSGANIVSLDLDDSVPNQLFEFLNQPFNFFHDPTLNFFNKPARVGVMIRCADGSFLVKEVTGTGGNVTTVTFVTPFIDPNVGNNVVIKGCLIGFGPLGSETQRLLVQQIAPKKDFTADITFVDEAPDLFANKPVKLLMHFNSNLTDSSSSPATVTGTAAFSTVNKRFGTASWSGNGSNTWVSAAEQQDEFNSSGDFTVDYWYRTAVTTTATLCFKGPSGTFGPWRIDSDGSGNLTFFSSSNGTSFDIANGMDFAPLMTDSQFHHVALCRQGRIFYFFQDGVPTFSFLTLLLPFYSNSPIWIGARSTSGGANNSFNGLIDEFRFTKGLARWTTSFVPPSVEGQP